MMEKAVNRIVHRKMWIFLSNPWLYTMQAWRVIEKALKQDWYGNKKPPKPPSVYTFKWYAANILYKNDPIFHAQFKSPQEFELFGLSHYCAGCMVYGGFCAFKDICPLRRVCKWEYNDYSGYVDSIHGDRELEKEEIMSITSTAMQIAFCNVEN